MYLLPGRPGNLRWGLRTRKERAPLAEIWSHHGLSDAMGPNLRRWLHAG